MNKKIFWLVAYLFCAVLSCYLTATSLSVIFPGMNVLVVWGLTIAIYLLASLGFMWAVEGYFNAHVLSYPKLMLWGGLALFLAAWGISLPTNTHTPIYQWQVGDVVTEDLETTRMYSMQLKDHKYETNDSTRVSEYKTLSESIYADFKQFQLQVATGNSDNNNDGESGFGKYANKYITQINSRLDKYGEEYKLQAPSATNRASKTELVNLLNNYENDELNPKLEKLRKSMLYVPEVSADKAKKHVTRIDSMMAIIDYLKVTGQISDNVNVPIIKTTADMLKEAYNNIKANKNFVRFNNSEDKKLYTAPNGETKTNRLFNPYATFGDLFSGDTPSYIFFYLIIAIIVDIAAFIFFSKVF